MEYEFAMSSEGRTRVLVVDDHRLMYDCLKPSLENRIRGLEVVGWADDGTKAIDEARRLQPDLVILDIDLPGMSSFDAAREMISRRPETMVMFLSAHQHDEYIEEALKVGARGYGLKNEELDAIVDGVRRVLDGELYYAPGVMDRITVGEDGELSLDRPPTTRLQTLTERERQILVMLARGESVKRIATALKIAYKTVDKHKVSLMKKLDIHDRVELCRFAVRERLIEP
ncbi:MAG: response regulator transcription factor [Planctomycetes bacterium]|nr:response regulator transcription factor [Planctomycetota bacterium]